MGQRQWVVEDQRRCLFFLGGDEEEEGAEILNTTVEKAGQKYKREKQRTEEGRKEQRDSLA